MIIVWSCLLLNALGVQGQELLRIYTDKDCYLAGENLWVKVCVNDSLLPGNELSKVAYVEVCDAQQVQAQGKVALTDGVGWACIRFPQTMHSGVYRLTAYTRYMRNYPAECFPKKNIAVLNAVQASEDDALVATDTTLFAPSEKPVAFKTEGLRTERPEYRTRSKVTLKGLDALADAKELTLSVVRRDSKVLLPAAPAARPLDMKPTGDYVAECEGHIVAGRLTGDANPLSVNLGCVGREIHFFEGKKQPDGTYLFFTSDVNDRRDAVLSTAFVESEGCRAEPISPFAEVLPEALPELHYWYDEQQLVERSIGAQIGLIQPNDTTAAPLSDLLFKDHPSHSYNLDEYVRFSTLRECLIEFVMGVRIDKRKGKSMLRTLNANSGQFYNSKALVLLDGVPVDDHDAILEYDGRLIHYIHQYRNTYVFGGKTYCGVISILTHRGAFSGMRTDANAQMFSYEFPQERPQFEAPRYDTPEQAESRRPDFRHTLCWLPQISAAAREVSFYTSDMKGTYVATLQGVLPDGRQVERRCEFVVK